MPFNKSLRDNIGQAAMQVHLEIPEDLARQLAADPGGVTHAALEAVALEGVRSGRFFLDLTLDDVRKDSETALAFSR
jgi:hypothetical protein